jgi:hypothetical protein
VSVATRVLCSLKALGAGWLISDVVFTLVVRDPRAILLWLFWGTPFFVIGGIFVGLPIVGLGDRTLRISRALIAVGGGLGGALSMALPGIVVGIIQPAAVHLDLSPAGLAWELIAFVIAAPTTLLYRVFLDRHAAKTTTNEESLNSW